MRKTDHIEAFRLTNGENQKYNTTKGDGNNGIFVIPHPTEPKIKLFCIISDGTDPRSPVPWEHVSVRAISKNANGKKYERVPNWAEMCFVKETFWGEGECVVQFHPVKENYVNIHPCVLHLWKWKGGEFPTPPIICV